MAPHRQISQKRQGDPVFSGDIVTKVGDIARFAYN